MNDFRRAQLSRANQLRKLERGAEQEVVHARTVSLLAMTATAEVQSGLEGGLAFATEIAEPYRAGGALRYRGVNIEELVGNVPFEQVWGLLVDGKMLPGMPPAEPHPLYV